jgi:hypothetical protein
MSLVFSDLTAADWAEFEQHSPAACAWLRARALEREYARLRGEKKLTTWQARRLEELRQLQVPDPPPAHPWRERKVQDAQPRAMQEERA